jgi:hypothetical protein
MLKLRRVLAAMLLVIGIAMVVGIGGVAALLPAHTLHLIIELDIIRVLYS